MCKCIINAIADSYKCNFNLARQARQHVQSDDLEDNNISFTPNHLGQT